MIILANAEFLKHAYAFLSRLHKQNKAYGNNSYRDASYSTVCSTGLTFSEKWNTDNTLATEITVQDYIAKGLKVSFDSSFAPQTG